MSSPFTSTGISVVTDRFGSLRVFYQVVGGHIEQNKQLNGTWTNERLSLNPVDGTPLASITYSSGREIRVYYLDTDYRVQEHRYTEGRGWYPGEISQLGARAIPHAGLAAIAYGSDVLGDGEQGVRIRVFYQNADTKSIEELVNDGYWHRGDMHVSDAIPATSLAAVAYYSEQTQIRVYYQARDLSLREHAHDGRGWFSGEFDSGDARTRTPLCALSLSSAQLQVYYHDLQGRLVFVKNPGAWGNPNVVQGMGPGYNFAVLQWQDGNRLRLYNQMTSGIIIEFCSDNGGWSWYRGQLRVG